MFFLVFTVAPNQYLCAIPSCALKLEPVAFRKPNQRVFFQPLYRLEFKRNYPADKTGATPGHSAGNAGFDS